VSVTEGFVPPAYPYERLDDARAVAAALPGGAVDCSIGAPCDPPPPEVIAALSASGSEKGYPASIGSPAFREAAAGWFDRRLGVSLDPAEDLAACIGTKEFVASLPHYLRLRHPEKDTVLYPEISYPSYAMGATLAGCRAVPVRTDEHFRIDVSSIDADDAARALCLWVNTPGNPAGGLDDLDSVAEWGRAHDLLVVSDECYVEFTWAGPPRTILSSGCEGKLAVHSLSKRSNLAGVRAGFYAGDADVVHYLREVRKHAGAMVPGPVQAASVAAWSDQEHVQVQRERYSRRLDLLVEIAAAAGVPAPRPAGAFYLWVPAPDGDAWALTNRLAEQGGLVVSPGEFYGDAGSGFVRIAASQPDEALEMVLGRLG
jgi:succinyldiaminopimelate transaminase